MQDLPDAAVAVLSSVDLGGLGDQVLARVVERELHARLPGLRIAEFAPLGWDRAGSTATPLARPERATTAKILESGQASVLCPTFPLGDDLAVRYASPQAQWAETYFAGGLVDPSHPVIPVGVRLAGKPTKSLVTAFARRLIPSVRDKVSLELLRSAGVDADIEVIPHPALLIQPPADRIASLRKLGVVPAGEYIVSPEPIEGEQVVTLPEELDDRLAVLANAKFVVATDEHTAATAAGLEVPWVLLDPTGSETAPVLEFGEPGQIVTSLGSLTETKSRKQDLLPKLADYFDRVAAAIETAVAANDGSPVKRWARLAQENQALRHANTRLRERMVVERSRMIDPIAGVVAHNDELEKQLVIARASYANMVQQNEILQAQVLERDRELLAWQNIRLVRWTNPIRNAYSKVRSFLR